MPQVTRHYCSRCGTSIYNCVINGRRVPLVFVMFVGQPADTGGAMAGDDDGVQIPSFVRALMGLPIPRVELCMRCVAEVFAQPVLLAADDPVTAINAVALARQNDGMDQAALAQVVTAHVYDALAHGQELAAGRAVAVPVSSLPVAPATGVATS